MAFCSNCGTPNTDQADKCVSCGKEIAKSPGAAAKGKFKGTIMMGAATGGSGPAFPLPGAAAAPPAAAAPAAAAPVAAALPQAAPNPAAPANDLAFQKTMIGGMAPPVAAPVPAPAAATLDPALAATLAQPQPSPLSSAHRPEAPVFTPVQMPSRSTATSIDPGSAGIDTSSSGAKMLIIGVLVLAVVIVIGAIYSRDSSKPATAPAPAGTAAPAPAQ